AFTRHTLCEYINMSRYRLFNRDNPDGPRLSWVIMPIKINGVTQAYFAIMEAHALLDYYDEFSVRIAFLLLQSIYEQISGATDAGYVGFENFIHFALSCNDDETVKVISQAGAQSISMSKAYNYSVIRTDNTSVGKKREVLMSAFTRTKCSRIGKLAILDDREMLLLTEVKGEKKRTADEEKQLIEEFMKQVHKILPDDEIKCGVAREGRTLRDIKRTTDKCRKVLKMGAVAFPDDEIVDYEMLGPLAWLDIPESELNEMLDKLRTIAKDDRNRDLMNTLRIYLENNMNYSVTAELLFVHINTIRKRIDRATELLKKEKLVGIHSSLSAPGSEHDWNDPIERMKMIILLQLLNADKKYH
ncbi:MAG: helix-turn-helix domain-containing protein, partial [Bacillota bacterium]|nr:helix-turn-helix domain-containing protein [Bacillota bacterium]